MGMLKELNVSDNNQAKETFSQESRQHANIEDVDVDIDVDVSVNVDMEYFSEVLPERNTESYVPSSAKFEVGIRYKYE